jgi:indolepyruvate ferredoxin oxidoreductase beta subunit
MNEITNIVVAGLGGQGVVKASDILADAAFWAGWDVKKTELHGMSQRGGSVTSDVRFGRQVLSPMVPPGEADFLVVLAKHEVEVHRGLLCPGGLLIPPDAVDPSLLPDRRSLNVGLLGVLSRHLPIPLPAWHEAIRKHFQTEWVETNRRAFDTGRA